MLYVLKVKLILNKGTNRVPDISSAHLSPWNRAYTKFRERKGSVSERQFHIQLDALIFNEKLKWNTRFYSVFGDISTEIMDTSVNRGVIITSLGARGFADVSRNKLNNFSHLTELNSAQGKRMEQTPLQNQGNTSFDFHCHVSISDATKN